ncbi:MAG TPA: ATP-binding protein [Anaerolineaceae bacterium]|nr:ATP-binding protein [Anaerolineaceae bacterium]HPC05887.1 ATP-binding protein [Anaerolineaceae bacterium]HQN04935.1 ATP-binding protein [Anaerolineaceae bacterium]
MTDLKVRAKQLIILSGKGGTGKTSLGAAFAHLSNQPEYGLKTVFVDADVDAANLSLVLLPETGEPKAFWGGSLAEIDPVKCTGCGACIPVCRYDAIFPDSQNSLVNWVDPVACDGCAACVYACPKGAITMVPQQEGNWYHSMTPYGALFHAELFPGRENSGKLVTLVKQQARLHAEDTLAPLVIIDGPPGIGCPVISACAGADLGLVVTEPSLAGLHDMKRVLGTLQHFRVPAVICINKADIFPEGASQIKEYALSEGFEIIGQVPFDESIPQAMLQGLPVMAFNPDSIASRAIKFIWEGTLAQLFGIREH